jgi:hypothetical protein
VFTIRAARRKASVAQKIDESQHRAPSGQARVLESPDRSSRRHVHRLRDLDARHRLISLAYGAGLFLGPVLAFIRVTRYWAPTGDTALMGLRALDVGTSHTPLIGQVSTSGFYVPTVEPVHHLGPVHFYVLALPVRLFGGAIGMPLVSVLIVGSCVLISAWVVFRQLGPAAGVMASVLLGAIMFTTGASSLIDPVSSRIAGYPLLCSAVLLWCVLCGDLRLLPLATAVVSFTAQQHLSVGPATVILTVGALLGMVASFVVRRRTVDPPGRRELARWAGWSAVVAIVLWAPVLVDQLTGDGNLGRLARYAGNNDHETLGLSAAGRAVVHTLGLPPLLGQTDFSGQWLLAEPSIFTWLTALAVLAGATALGVHWRRTNPRRAGLVIMLWIAVLAGLVSASSVPVGFEQFRPAFYHWAFIVSFFAWLILGLGILDVARNLNPSTQHALVRVATPLALITIIFVGVANQAVERATNTPEALRGFWKEQYLDDLAEAVLAHRDQLGSETVVLGGEFRGLAFALAERGLKVDVPHKLDGHVNTSRLARRANVQSGLVMVIDTKTGRGKTPPGLLLVQRQHLHTGDDVYNPFEIEGFRLYLLSRQQLLSVVQHGDL